MLAVFKSSEMGPPVLRRCEDFEPGSWVVLTAPTDDEISEVSRRLGVIPDFLRYPLDPEEKSRVEVDEGQTMVLIDVPVVADTMEYSTIPLGIVLNGECLITVCLRETPILGDFIEGKVKGASTLNRERFLLAILLRAVDYYLRYLRAINRSREEIERALQKSMSNTEVMQLLDLEKSLVFFTTSLRANGGVLDRLHRVRTLRLDEDGIEALEDVIIENKQAIEMADIYTNILGGMMDAFTSIISNNLNIVIRLLTSVTIVLAIPTLVASFYGMNVELPFQKFSHAFTVVVLLSLGLSALVALVLARYRLF